MADDSPISEIQVVIQHYLDGIHFGRVEDLQRAMHPDCRMISLSDETYAKTDMATYFQVVANRQSPHAVGEPREERVLEISAPDDNIATVRLECLVLGKACRDTLILIKADNNWSITSKVFWFEQRTA
ncbi:MAG: nuclear transport factor 2 family protein [Pseudomonadota bacterium]